MPRERINQGGEIMKVWFDLTDLSQWRGHHTGIQRVVYQLARQLEADADAIDVGFFIYNSRDRQFYSADLSKIVARVEAQVGAASSTGVIRSDAGLVRRLKAAIRTLSYQLPHPIRQRLPYALIGRTVHLSHKAVNMIRAQHQSAPPAPVFTGISTASFRKEDKVLVFGSEWDNVTFMPSIVEARQKVGFKLYQVVYDMIPAIMPQLFGESLLPRFTKYMFEVGASSDGLFAISESSRLDMISFCTELEISPPPIGVIRLGDDFVKPHNMLKPSIPVEPGKFLVSVGTIEIRKNHALLYQAYRLAHEDGIELPPIVIVGKRGWLSGDILNAIEHDPLMKGKIFTLNDASDGVLGWLYENCLFSVYPSLYEGWGLPIAESLAYGKMCISSNTSSMTEIAGDLIEYHSPYDARGLLDIITKYLDPQVLEARVNLIHAEYRPGTWQQAYRQIIDLLEQH